MEPMLYALMFADARGPRPLGIRDTPVAGKSPLFCSENDTLTVFEDTLEYVHKPVRLTVAPNEVYASAIIDNSIIAAKIRTAIHLKYQTSNIY